MRKIRSVGLVVLGFLVICGVVGREVEAGERTHTVVKGDTLWDLSAFYYGTPWEWPRIAEANPPPDVNDPHWIYPKQVIVIPGLETSEGATEASAAIAPPPQALAHAEPRGKKKRYIRPMEELSDEMPPGQTGQSEAMPREVFDKDWKADGKIITYYDGAEGAVAAGEYVYARFEPGITVLVSERFTVYRLTSRLITEPRDGAIRVQKAGVVEAVEEEPGGRWKMLIVDSSDTVQVEDLLKRSAGR